MDQMYKLLHIQISKEIKVKALLKILGAQLNQAQLVEG